MELANTSRSDVARKTFASHAWLIFPILIAGWWIHELSFLWASMPEYRFGWIVVLLTGYLIWERWPTRPALDHLNKITPAFSILLGAIAFPLVLTAELYKQGVARIPSATMILSVGCALFLISLVSLLAGWRSVRHFLFPLLFFFIAVPLPHLIWDPIVFGLRRVVTDVNVETLNLLGIPAEQQGNLIRLPRCTVGVDEACSGVRSLQSSIMAALFIGDILLRKAGWKIVFFVAGVLLAIVGNFGRSLYLSLTAHYRGPEALHNVHDSAGWSVLLFTAVGVGLLAWRVERLERSQGKSPSPPGTSS